MDLTTLERWIARAGFSSSVEDASTVRVDHGDPELPAFFVQLSQHWVLLSMLPMLARGASRSESLDLELLAANRDMRLAKFALDAEGDVILCAELPTESLDESELVDALQRVVRYARAFRAARPKHVTAG